MMDGHHNRVKPVLTEREQSKKDQLLSGPSSGGADQATIDAMF